MKRKILIYIEEVEDIFGQSPLSRFIRNPQLLTIDGKPAWIRELEYMFSIPVALYSHFYFYGTEKIGATINIMEILLINFPRVFETSDFTTPDHFLHDFDTYPPLGLPAIPTDISSKH